MGIIKRNKFLALISFFAFTSILFISNQVKGNPDMNRGEMLYLEQCSKCHRKNGKGIKGIYPPLRKSDYILKESPEELLRGMIYGRSGKIEVNGETYNGVMTTEIDASLSDEEIALILTYVLIELNDINYFVSSKEVISARKKGKLPVK